MQAATQSLPFFVSGGAPDRSENKTAVVKGANTDAGQTEAITGSSSDTAHIIPINDLHRGSRPSSSWIFDQPISAVTGRVSNAGIWASSEQQAVEAALGKRELFKSGLLQEEVVKLGISPAWLAKLHTGPTYVAFTEQLNFLPTIFSRIGDLGKPEILSGAMASMQRIAAELRRSGLSDVKTGVLFSPHNQVTFHGVTHAFALTPPSFPSRKFDSGPLFTSTERKRLNGVGYGDLNFSMQKIDALVQTFEEVLVEAERAHIKAGKKFTYHQKDAPTTDANWREVSSTAFSCEMTFNAAQQFLADLRSIRTALQAKFGGNEFPYGEFIAGLNSGFASRAGNNEFGAFSTNVLNLFPILGLQRPAEFFDRMISSGAINSTDTLLWQRYERPSGQPAYRALKLDSMNGRDIFVTDGQAVHNLAGLLEKARSDLSDSGMPSIVPTSSLRYLVNFVLSPAVCFDDGVPYAKLEKMAQAAARHVDDGGIALTPRNLGIFPYTPAPKVYASTASVSYEELLPRNGIGFNVIDYYREISFREGR